jgi:hypothetical protein
MKPFSKFEAIGEGKAVVTRDGRKVTQLKEFEVIGPYQIVGVVEGKNATTAWIGGWVAFGAEENQVSHGLVGFATHVWPTEKEAVSSYKCANDGHEPKGTVKISWEE